MDIFNLQGWSASDNSLGIASLPFEHLTHVRQVHFYAMFIFVGLYIHITEIPRGTQFSDGCVSHLLISL